MRNFLKTLANPRAHLAYLLLAATLLLGSCKKDEDKDADPVGIIAGKISPASSITKVTATSATASTDVTPASDGAFSIGNLKAGNYSLNFTAASGYTAPVERSITVEAGKTNDQGIITVATTGGMSFKADGNPITAITVTAQIITGTLIITGSSATQNIVLVTIAGVGNYTLGPSSSASAAYSATSTGGAINTYSASSGSVQITSFDSANRKASGTFIFTAIPYSSGAIGTRVITDGVFTNVAF